MAAVGVAACTQAAPADASKPAAPAPPAVVQPGAPGQPTTTVPSGSPTVIEIPKSMPADVKFMQGMIHHHAQALEMTALLYTNSQREDMKLLAKRIDISQNDEIKMMRQWLKDRNETIMVDHVAHGMTMPAMPGMLTADQMAALAKAKGAEFDRLFLRGMIQHHQGALVMVEELFDAPGAAQESVIFDFATHVDADQRAEITRMMQMLKDRK
jgi:uncharacterized protein (DUF305 family)